MLDIDKIRLSEICSKDNSMECSIFEYFNGKLIGDKNEWISSWKENCKVRI